MVFDQSACQFAQEEQPEGEGILPPKEKSRRNTCRTGLVKTLRIKPQVCLWSKGQRTRVETWTVGHVTTVLSPFDWEGLLTAATQALSVP